MRTVSSTWVWMLVSCQMLSVGWAQQRPAGRSGDRPPVSTQAAFEDGRRDGAPDGQREGHDRGRAEGEREGRQRGYQKGYDECLASRRQQAFERGHSAGYLQGSYRGRDEGHLRGEVEGRGRGDSEGRRDGDLRADRAARTDSEAPARARGQQEAELTDSFAQGAAAGARDGEARALRTALEVDFQAGRESHRQARFAEAIQKQVTEDLTQVRVAALHEAPASRISALVESTLQPALTSFASPDFRYRNERPRYPDPESRQAYSRGYHQGYRQGFSRVYDQQYRWAESQAYEPARREGCRNAERQEVRQDYDRGYRRGYDLGYRRAFDDSYQLAFRSSYDRSFAAASAEAYSLNYSLHYSRWFEKFRADAYAERVQSLYRQGYDREEEAEFQRKYPAYARQEFQRGVDEEARDFRERPVRAVDFRVREEVADSVYEPGERVDFGFSLRNFSAQDLEASDLRFELEILGSGGAPIRAIDLGRGVVPAHGLLSVVGAIPARLLEAGLGKVTRVRARVLYKGGLLEAREVEMEVRNRASLEWVQSPVLREGLSTTLKLRITNRSTLPIAGPVDVQLRADTEQVELKANQLSLSGLAAGESRELSLEAVGRSDLDSVHFPLGVLVLDGAKRRVLTHDFSARVPVLNDYRIQLVTAPERLRSAGLVRLDYRLRNVSSRLVFSSLELHARWLDSQGRPREEVEWIGFNPQFLLPLEQGEQVKFVIPAFLKTAIEAGVVELEVRENGVPVVIHRALH